MIQRRAFLAGLASALAAPAIVRAIAPPPTMTAIQLVNRAAQRSGEYLIPTGPWKVQWGSHIVEHIWHHGKLVDRNMLHIQPA